MADATRLQTLSKQSDEQRQATEVITTQIEKRTQSQAQIDELIQSHQRMEAMMAALMSQRSNQLSRPPDPPYSEAMMKNHCNQASISPIRPHETNFSPTIIPITSSKLPKPPDPPDIRKSEQNLATKAIDPPNFTKSNLISVVKAAPGKTKASTRKLLRYSCEEVYERMENGLCMFCEEQDTPGHYNLKHRRSHMFIIESEDEQLSDDNNLVEPALEEIVDEPMEKTLIISPNPENESQPEVSVSQCQVPLSSMEPSRRCRNNSLDVVDERMSNELVCGKDGDYILTVSAKFLEIYEDPRFELVCLKHPHDPVENHMDNFEFALTRSSLQHTPTDQYRAPFSPYQNCNDTGHYKREFGNYSEPGIELDRASEEVEDDELQDKQPEEDVETLVISENQQSLECVDDESSVDEELIEVIAEKTALEPMDESSCSFYKERNLNSLLLPESQIILLHFEESSDTTVPCLNLETKALHSLLSVGGIMLLSDSKRQSLLAPYAGLPCSWHISSDMVCGFLQPLLTVAINSRMILVSSGIILADDIVVTLRKTLEDKSVLRMEKVCIEGIKHNLEFAIDRGWVKHWINTHVFTLTNSGLRLSSSEYTKNTLILVYHLCTLSSSRLFVKTYAGCIVALLMVSDAERLIQLVSPLFFSDLLCFKNRIRVRLKMVLLLEFLWLILFTSKMFKSSSVPQNKNQTNQNLSLYWKILLRLLYPLHINRRSFYLWMIKPVSSNSVVTSCSRFGFFPYSTLMVSQNRHASLSCALRQEEDCVLVLFTIAEALTFFNDQHTLVAEKNGTETPIVLKRGVFHLQRPPELIDLPGNPNFITKVLVQWKEHPPDQFSQAFIGKYSCFHP